MKIQYNGETIQVSENDLTAFLEVKDLADKSGIACAVNGTVIPKQNWVNTKLTEGDEVMVITATQGG